MNLADQLCKTQKKECEEHLLLQHSADRTYFMGGYLIVFKRYLYLFAEFIRRPAITLNSVIVFY